MIPVKSKKVGRLKSASPVNTKKELGVSKQTLINWSKEKDVKVTINTAKLMEYESIISEKERGLR